MQSVRHSPAVSVVVPCYNAGPFINGLLVTLANQTFSNFETIIVDDGSTDDGTVDLLSTLDASVTVIRQRNKGPAAARNAGIRAARAALILALDCDDTIEPTFLEETVTVLNRAPTDVGYVFTDMRLNGLKDKILARNFKHFDQLFVNRVPCCILLRKIAWEISGGYDEAMVDGFEDWEFTIALANAGFRGVGITKPLFVYRVNDNGHMMSRAARLHGELWTYIRRKHREFYHPSALLRLWWRTRSLPGELTLSRAFLLLALGTALPPSWSNRFLFYRLRIRMHLAKGALGRFLRRDRIYKRNG